MKYIEIRLTKCRLYLTEPELVRLLQRDPALWREAIRRGKWARRAAANERRELKHISEVLPAVLEKVGRRREKWK